MVEKDKANQRTKVETSDRGDRPDPLRLVRTGDKGDTCSET